jgi:hypothetical protein
MVALNKDTKSPKPIPGLLLEGDEEIRRFLEGHLRRKVRKLQWHELEQARSETDYDIDERSLEGESCKIAAG